MTKANFKKLHGGMAILLAVLMVNALGIELVEGKSLKHPKKEMSSENGEVINCIDIYRQPAFDHPFLKNHTIQMKPTSYPKGCKIKKSQEKILIEVECPEGTIPIGRTQNHIGDRVPFVVSKTKLFYNHSYDIKNQNLQHEFAAVSLVDGTYFGAHAAVNVWNPITIFDEVSFSDIGLRSDFGDNLNMMLAGWMVYPEKFGPETRFFMYWTADNYKHGCYNLECPGFVQVSKKHILGAPIRPVSKYNSQQYQIDITIHQDQKTKNWWLRFNNEDLGYWPASIFTTIGGGAKSITWGGEITNRQFNYHHTTTQMGSGRFPFEGFGQASYFRALKYIDVSGKTLDADNLTIQVSNPSCYDLQIREKKQDAFGVNFYYGGPGYSARCQ